MPATRKKAKKSRTKVSPSTNGVANFDLGYLDISGKTVKFALPWITPAKGCKEVYLLVSPATDANPEWQEQLLSRAADRVQPDGNLEERDGAVSRDEDIEAYPGPVIKGWAGVPNAAGSEAPWSDVNCRAFLRHLVDNGASWIVDRLRIFVMRPASFMEKPNPVELAGNSSGA